MDINISRLNLAEKDIEDWLWEHPSRVCVDSYLPWRITKWLARQYKLPSGIADLIGLTESNHVVVVEVKNVPADSRAITQVSRYAHDVLEILKCYPRHMLESPVGAFVLKAVVAPSVDSLTTFYEARACQVYMQEFTASLLVDLYSAYPGTEGDARRYGDYDAQIEQIAQGQEWSHFGNFYKADTRRLIDELIEHEQEMICDSGDAEHF